MIITIIIRYSIKRAGRFLGVAYIIILSFIFNDPLVKGDLSGPIEAAIDTSVKCGGASHRHPFASIVHWSLNRLDTTLATHRYVYNLDSASRGNSVTTMAGSCWNHVIIAARNALFIRTPNIYVTGSA